MDLFYECGKFRGNDVDCQPVSGTVVAFLWCLGRCGNFFKKYSLVRFVDELRGGTHLHAAAFMDKPSVVTWLLEKGADATRKTKNGKTGLTSAIKPKPGTGPIHWGSSFRLFGGGLPLNNLLVHFAWGGKVSCNS